MPREITDRGRVVEAIQHLALTAELFEEQNGKQKYASDLEVIVQGRDYGNGKLMAGGVSTSALGMDTKSGGRTPTT